MESAVTSSRMERRKQGKALRGRMPRTSQAEWKPRSNSQDPVFRQTTLDGTAGLVPGKPLILGSLDIPGTHRHQQVEVVSEAIP
jgi:hypothetical protein